MEATKPRMSWAEMMAKSTADKTADSKWFAPLEKVVPKKDLSVPKEVAADQQMAGPSSAKVTKATTAALRPEPTHQRSELILFTSHLIKLINN
jgi:hypothetical protein